jgi:hypothetical protein
MVSDFVFTLMSTTKFLRAWIFHLESIYNFIIDPILMHFISMNWLGRDILIVCQQISSVSYCYEGQQNLNLLFFIRNRRIGKSKLSGI